MSEVVTFPTPDQLEQLQRETSYRKLSRFPVVSLLWLAALPQWTQPLAEAVGFPTDHVPLPELVDRFRTAELIEQTESLDIDGTAHPSFWMPAARRAEIGAYLQTSALGPHLVDQVQDLAEAVRSVLAGSPDLDLPGLRHWIRLATEHLSDPSGLRLLTDVDEMITDGQASDAVTVVGAAEALGDVVGEPLASAARRAQWRIDRGYREALDAASLRDYLPRPDLEDALVALVEHGTPWAMHFLGQGGVGKTMLIRYLASGELTRRRGLPHVPVARVDFDHLDPRYPEGRPAELLLALAAELAGFSRTRDALYTLRRLEDSGTAVHEALSAPERTGAETDPLHDPLLADAIIAFAEFAGRLDERVLLVLDTTEELAKLHAPGTPSRAVDLTFAILERVHELSPNVRVLLAGRRWLVPPPDGTRRAGEGDYPPRPYLQVLPVRGFTEDQAREYMRAGDPERRVGPELTDAVLRRCAAPDGTVIPFDLAGYRAWVLAEPDLDAQRLLTAPGDPYVEQRIISRLTDPAVRDALPLAAELGRFELAMIEPTLRRSGIEPEVAFAGLAAQEWVSAVSFHPDGRPRVVEVDEPLRPRLRAVLAADPSRFPVDRLQLGRDMAELINRAPVVEDLAIEAVEAALRLLPAVEAGQMWDRFEGRIADQNAWSWGVTVLPRTAGAEVERTAAGGPTVLAAIRATQAAAALRLPGRPGLEGLWEEVLVLAERHPDPELRARLAMRAILGSPTRVGDGLMLAPTGAAAIPEDAAIAFCERLTVDLGELSGARLDSFAEFIDRLVLTTTDEIREAGLLCHAAVLARQGEHEEALDRVEVAFWSQATSQVTGPPPRHVDWVVPAGLVHRARLARVVLALLRAEQPETMPLDQWVTEALSDVADIDAERLVSACLTLRLAWAPIPIKSLEVAAAAEHYVPDRQPAHYWHRQVDTLCCTLALGMAGIGQVDRAAGALRKRREEAVSAGSDPATILSCDATLVRLSRLARDQLSSSIRSLAKEGPPGVRADALAVLTLLGVEPSVTPFEPAGDAGGEVPGDVSSVYHLLEDDARLLRSVLRSGGDVTGVLDELGLPPRLLAQVTLAEAEVIALDNPRDAVPLLARARNDFSRAADRWGVARAAILTCMAYYRAGEPVDPARARRPDWADVPVEELGRGWAQRVEFATDVWAGRHPPSGLSPETGSQVLSRPGPAAQPQSAPPPAASRPAMPSPAAEAADAPPPARGRTLRRTPALAISAALLVLLGLAVVYAIATGSQGGSALRAISSVPTLAFWVVAAIAVVLVVAGGVLLVARSGLLADLLPGTREGRFKQRTVAVDPTDQSWRPCVVSVAPKRLTIKIASAPARPIGDLTRGSEELRPGTPPYLLIPLVSRDEDGDLAQGAPEQDLGRSLPDIEGKPPLPIRAGFGYRSIEREISARFDNVIVGYQGPPAFAPSPSPPTSARSEQVSLLVGTPLSTSGGWRIRVHAASSASQPSRPSQPSQSGSQPSGQPLGSPYSGYTQRSAGPGEVLLGADDLVESHSLLYALFAEPVDGPPRPLGRLRPGMTAIARELMGLSGWPAVLVIPPLPDELLRDVIRTIFDRATARPELFGFGRVFDVVHEVRTMIRAAEAGPGRAAHDRAGEDSALSDVLLFMF